MELLTATIVLCSTLMMLWGATMLVVMSRGLSLITIVNPPARLIFTQNIREAYFRTDTTGSNGLVYGTT